MLGWNLLSRRRVPVGGPRVAERAIPLVFVASVVPAVFYSSIDAIAPAIARWYFLAAHRRVRAPTVRCKCAVQPFDARFNFLKQRLGLLASLLEVILDSIDAAAGSRARGRSSGAVRGLVARRQSGGSRRLGSA